MNECCWIRSLEQFLRCVGRSKLVIDTKSCNSSFSPPHKTQMLELCMARKREEINEFAFSSFCAPQVPARVTKLSGYISALFLISTRGSSPLSSLCYEAIRQDDSNWYILLVFIPQYKLKCQKKLFPCCSWQEEFYRDPFGLAFSLFLPSYFFVRSLLHTEICVLLC